jgi:hypothetical protein
MPALSQHIGDAYMDGDYGKDGKSRLTVTDADGYWVMDTNDDSTAYKRAAECGGTIKRYDGRDKYRPR